MVIKEFLEKQPVDIQVHDVLPDDQEQITDRLKELADKEKMQLILTAGGTGLGPRDVTPEATLGVLDRTIPGILESIRRCSNGAFKTARVTHKVTRGQQ